MMSSKTLLFMIGVSGLAAMSALGKMHTKSRQEVKQSRKKEMQTWEGEGGNLPPAAGTPAMPGNVAGNGTVIN